jgi:hypothetical protein
MQGTIVGLVCPLSPFSVPVAFGEAADAAEESQ